MEYVLGLLVKIRKLLSFFSCKPEEKYFQDRDTGLYVLIKTFHQVLCSDWYFCSYWIVLKHFIRFMYVRVNIGRLCNKYWVYFFNFCKTIWKFEWTCIPTTNKMIPRKHWKADSQILASRTCLTFTYFLQ